MNIYIPTVKNIQCTHIYSDRVMGWDLLIEEFGKITSTDAFKIIPPKVVRHGGTRNIRKNTLLTIYRK